MTQYEEEWVQECLSQYRDRINSTPALISLLFHANLLPEQITTKKEAKILANICIAYNLGLAAVQPSGTILSYPKVSRVEVIGTLRRDYTNIEADAVNVSIQDAGQTLKIFLNTRK
jgi:hypothetical protein